MSVRPAAAPSSPSLAEMERLVAQAGLTLNAGQMADLVLAWRQIVGLIARIPRTRPLLDDQAYVFRLPPDGPGVSPPLPAHKSRGKLPPPMPMKAAAKQAAGRAGKAPAKARAAAEKPLGPRKAKGRRT